MFLWQRVLPNLKMTVFFNKQMKPQTFVNNWSSDSVPQLSWTERTRLFVFFLTYSKTHHNLHAPIPGEN